jgi:hypothetical protein
MKMLFSMAVLLLGAFAAESNDIGDYEDPGDCVCDLT